MKRTKPPMLLPDGKRLLRIEETILYEEGAVMLRDKLIELFPPLQEKARTHIDVVQAIDESRWQKRGREFL